MQSLTTYQVMPAAACTPCRVGSATLIDTDKPATVILEIPPPKTGDDGEIPATPSDANRTNDKIGSSRFVGMIHFDPDSESIYRILFDSDSEGEKFSRSLHHVHGRA